LASDTGNLLILGLILNLCSNAHVLEIALFEFHLRSTDHMKLLILLETPEHQPQCSESSEPFDNNRARDAVASGELLAAVRPFFEQARFQPIPIDLVIALADGRADYREVDRGQIRERLI
jgi:hypothetical protein